MLTTDSLSNINPSAKNILRDGKEYNLNNSFGNIYSQNEFSNLIFNSNLENENIIK